LLLVLNFAAGTFWCFGNKGILECSMSETRKYSQVQALFESPSQPQAFCLSKQKRSWIFRGLLSLQTRRVRFFPQQILEKFPWWAPQTGLTKEIKCKRPIMAIAGRLFSTLFNCTNSPYTTNTRSPPRQDPAAYTSNKYLIMAPHSYTPTPVSIITPSLPNFIFFFFSCYFLCRGKLGSQESSFPCMLGSGVPL
jgi:hypothetical protein